MKFTQQNIADHLDMSQKTASVFLRQLDFDWRDATLDEIRIAYMRKLRERGAALVTSDGSSLVRERVMTEQVNREIKEFQLDQTKAQLVNLAQLEAELTAMVGAFRASMLEHDKNLKTEIERQYGIDVDMGLIQQHTEAAFSHFGKYDVCGG